MYKYTNCVRGTTTSREKVAIYLLHLTQCYVYLADMMRLASGPRKSQNNDVARLAIQDLASEHNVMIVTRPASLPIARALSSAAIQPGR